MLSGVQAVESLRELVGACAEVGGHEPGRHLRRSRAGAGAMPCATGSPRRPCRLLAMTCPPNRRGVRQPPSASPPPFDFAPLRSGRTGSRSS
jgi:hypothetical protein